MPLFRALAKNMAPMTNADESPTNRLTLFPIYLSLFIVSTLWPYAFSYLPVSLCSIYSLATRPYSCTRFPRDRGKIVTNLITSAQFKVQEMGSRFADHICIWSTRRLFSDRRHILHVSNSIA